MAALLMVAPVGEQMLVDFHPGSPHQYKQKQAGEET
jgi:hypothetical protein